MSKANLLPLEDITDNTGDYSGLSVTADGEVINAADCPFTFLDESQTTNQQLYKIYNDGHHYVATPYFHSYGKRKSNLSPLDRVFRHLYYDAVKKQYCYERCYKLQHKPLHVDKFVERVIPVLKKRFPNHRITEKAVIEMLRRLKESNTTEVKTKKDNAMDIAFNSLYSHGVRVGLKDEELTSEIKTGLEKLFPEKSDTIGGYIEKGIEKKRRNYYARKKRFHRKANLNRWNYFVTFTYDDKKHTAETFRKKLRKCLSNLHTRRGWKYMGVFEESPETGRLHFHGLLYVPSGEMVGKIKEMKDYSTSQGKIQITYNNDFFAESFGRNDFSEITEMELRHGQTLNYILKYIEKTGERIVYSRGIPTQVCKILPETEIVGRMQDFMVKFVLFDDTIEWERDIMRYTAKQISIIDMLCNPPQAA